jgi:2-polyprenyl-3-methyl-5-hydroxy-6-metoxy-1,4-benzoquinol methylase
MKTSDELDVTKLSLQTAYNTIAKKYLAYVQQSPDVRPDYLEQLFSLLLEPSFPIRALELGCGPGVPGTQILAERCQQVTAIDLSEEQLRLARSHVTGDNVTFLHGDMAALRFGPNSFEVVVALHSLFHLSPEDQRAVIGRLSEWLSVGGILLCSLQPTQCAAGENEFLGAHTYCSSFGSEGNRQVLREAGFDIVKDLIEVEGGDDRFMNHWIWARKSKSC